MGCRTGGLAGQWGSPRPRSATAWTCCCPSWPPSGTASPTGGSSPPLKTCANGLGRWPQPARRSWSTGSAPGCSGPPAGSTRRSCTTPSGTPIPPRGWRCRPSGATCCGATVAGRAAATSRSSSSWRGWARCWTPPAWRACWTGGFGAWPRPVRTGTRRSGTAGPNTGSATRSGRSTACRRGCARWWSSRSGIWPTRGRCVAGGGCCTGSGTSTGPPASSFAWAGGCTGSPHEGARSITDTLIQHRQLQSVLRLVDGAELQAGEHQPPPDPEHVGPFPELLLDAERGLQVPLCLIALVDLHAQLADPGMGQGPHPRCRCLLVLERFKHPPGGLQRAVQVALVLPQIAGEAVGDPGQHRLAALAQRLQCGALRPQELG